MEKPVILCVDDEKSMLVGLRDELKFELGNDYSIEISESGEEALELINELHRMRIPVPVVISDQLMPNMRGDELLINIHKSYPSIRKILLTGQASADAVGNAVNHANLYRYIAKPWDPQDLLMSVKEAARSFFTDNELTEHLNLWKSLSELTLELSQIISLQILYQTILAKAALYTGASRACLTLYSEENFTHGIFAHISNNQQVEYEIIDSAQHLEGKLATGFLNAVLISRKPVISGRAWKEGPWKEDPYVIQYKTRSVYCAPILNNNNSLEAVLYLENNESTNEFTPIEQEFLSVLLKQAAISIDKAKLYEDLENRVLARTKELEEKNAIIAEKNNDITDSILYAQRIQYAILSDPTCFYRRFPDSFISYHPKDIVSGDFYWFAEEEMLFYLCAADCTGHGVPGAFMSLLGSSQLSDIIKFNRTYATDEVLNQLHDRIMANLHKNVNAQHLKDGIDLSLCRINTANGMMQFSAANRPVIWLHEGEIQVLEPDKLPIGYSVAAPEMTGRKFSYQLFQLSPGDRLYLYTDGITDQFGQDNQRKLGRNRLHEFLLENRHLTMAEQKTAFETYLENWRGNRSQTDDILLIGLEFNPKN